MFALLLPVLLGVLGLTIDGGLMMVVYRQTQNAADAAALAAAVDLL
jgi:Flp pilus assembly protein TadG